MIFYFDKEKFINDVLGNRISIEGLKLLEIILRDIFFG